MGVEGLDLSGSLHWDEGLPRPQWDVISAWVLEHAPEQRLDAWTTAARSWLTHLADAFGPPYRTSESDSFLLLTPNIETAEPLLGFAASCRNRLLTILSGVAGFQAYGKLVIIQLQNATDYYRYISPFFPEGELGGSCGVQIREDYAHIALHGWDRNAVENTLAHELTHAALSHLGMPQWIEEGLAQTFEHEMTHRSLLAVDTEMAARHKRYWSRHGLDDFWRGDGFAKSGKVQELSYQLAEILARLMLEDARPRWFGWVREPQVRYFEFLQSANTADCGEAACQKHLGCSLSDLAARFLGKGNWSPGL